MPLFTGYVAHTVPVATFNGPPRTYAQKYEMTTLQARILAPKMAGIPFVVVHKDALLSGKVVWGHVTDDGKFIAQVDLDTSTPSGKMLHDLIQHGIFDNFSLQHDPDTLTPTHLSLCKKGARDNTFIFDKPACTRDLTDVRAAAESQCKTNNPIDKQNTQPSTLVSASSSAAAKMNPSPGASLANMIYQDASSAMANSGLGAMPGTDAASSQLQQQQFMESLFKTYINQQQQPKPQAPAHQQHQQTEPAEQQQMKQDTPPPPPQQQPMSEDHIATQALVKLGLNGINTAPERAAIIGKVNKLAQQTEALKQENARLQKEASTAKALNDDYLVKFHDTVLECLQNPDKAQEYKVSSRSCSDATTSIHTALPALISASASFKNQTDELTRLRQENSRLAQANQTLFAAAMQAHAQAKPTPPQVQQPAPPPQVQQPLPQQQMQPNMFTPDFLAMLSSVQTLMYPQQQQYAAPPPQQSDAMSQELISASRTSSKYKRSRDNEPLSNGGYTFKPTPMPADTAAFYSDIGTTRVNGADVAEYRQSLGETVDTEACAPISGMRQTVKAMRPLISASAVPVNNNRRVKFQEDDDPEE